MHYLKRCDTFMSSHKEPTEGYDDVVVLNAEISAEMNKIYELYDDDKLVEEYDKYREIIVYQVEFKP